jgi:rhodanese-related sulfurtransferase
MESVHHPWRLWVLVALAVALAPLAARASDPEPFKRLSIDEAAALLGQPGVVFLDANPPDVYAKGHVPGAVLAERPLAAEQLPPDKATKVVAYCKNPK